MVSKIGHRQKEEAFLLKSVDYSDNHRILSMFTSSQGRLDFIALGAQNSKKRFSGVLDYLNCLRIDFIKPSRGSLLQLESVELIQEYTALRSDYDRMQAALSWLKLLHQVLKPYGVVPGLFLLMNEGFSALEQGDGLWEDIVFRRKALGLLGYGLQLEYCTHCGNSEGNFCHFLLEEGGMVCESCHPLKKNPIMGGFFSKFPWEFSTEPPQWLKDRGAQARKILDEAFQNYFAL